MGRRWPSIWAFVAIKREKKTKNKSGWNFSWCQILLQSLSKDIGRLHFQKIHFKKFSKLLALLWQYPWVSWASVSALTFWNSLLVCLFHTWWTCWFHNMPAHESICYDGMVPLLQRDMPIVTSPSASQSGISNNALRDTVNCIPFSKEVFPGKAQAAKRGTHLSLWWVTHGPVQCRPSPLDATGSVCIELLVHLVKAMVFPVVMYACELDHKEGSVPKNWCFWAVLLEKTLENPLDSKEIKPVNPKGNEPWIFPGRTDAKAEASILWPPDAKCWLTGKDPDAGKDWRQEEKAMTEDEMVGWYPWLNGREFEQTPGDGEGKKSLVCYNPWGHKESDMTEQLNNRFLWYTALPFLTPPLFFCHVSELFKAI